MSPDLTQDSEFAIRSKAILKKYDEARNNEISNRASATMTSEKFVSLSKEIKNLEAELKKFTDEERELKTLINSQKEAIKAKKPFEALFLNVLDNKRKKEESKVKGIIEDLDAKLEALKGKIQALCLELDRKNQDLNSLLKECESNETMKPFLEKWQADLDKELANLQAEFEMNLKSTVDPSIVSSSVEKGKSDAESEEERKKKEEATKQALKIPTVSGNLGDPLQPTVGKSATLPSAKPSASENPITPSKENLELTEEEKKKALEEQIKAKELEPLKHQKPQEAETTELEKIEVDSLGPENKHKEGDVVLKTQTNSDAEISKEEKDEHAKAGKTTPKPSIEGDNLGDPLKPQNAPASSGPDPSKSTGKPSAPLKHQPADESDKKKSELSDDATTKKNPKQSSEKVQKDDEKDKEKTESGSNTTRKVLWVLAFVGIISASGIVIWVVYRNFGSSDENDSEDKEDQDFENSDSEDDLEKQGKKKPALARPQTASLDEEDDSNGDESDE